MARGRFGTRGGCVSVRKSRSLVSLIAVMALAGLLLLAARPVSAHEHVNVGPYGFTVGWLDEPAIADVKNGLDMGVNKTLSNGTVVWVLGAENNLSAVIMSGPASSTQALAPQEGRDGWYTFPIIPTIAGSYSVRIVGTLGGTAINITVPLDDVQASSTVEFPVPNPTPSQLQGNDNTLSSQVSSLQSQVALATDVAAVAVVFGLAGVGVGLLSWRRGRKNP
jgi:hypothetical protein